jgi:enoyl-CoA hydratase/carnithine racemase
MSERVKVTVADGIADVRLDRPDKLNGLDRGMFAALDALGGRIAADRSIRCVVLSGEGRSFCAGLDFMSFMEDGGDGPSGSLLDRPDGAVANLAQRAAQVFLEIPVPVIAALHGHVYGGGLQIALAADIRFCHPDARLSVMEIKWGLIPDMTGTQTLRRLVRLDVARELTYTGRIFSGAEAAALGVVTRLSDNPHEDAMVLAREIAAKSPDAIRAAKEVLDRAGDVGFAEGLLLEEQIQKRIIGRPNQLEAVKANFEKRPANFSDPD